MDKRFLAILLAALLFLSTAAAKSYTLEKADLHYKITPNGLVEATEEITFSFNGQFTFAYRDIPKGSWQVTNIEVLEGQNPLQFELLDQGSDTRVKWYYSALDEKRTFTIKYELSKAVKAYSDIGEFYWKVWGEGWDHSLAELYGEIELPAAVTDPKEAYSWGHPELNGKIGLVENSKLIFQAFNIPAGQWVEIRTAFPVELLESSEHTVSLSRPGLEKIIAEEDAWASAAETRSFLNSPWFIPLFILLELAVFALSWHFYGREPKVELQAIYEREVPYKYSPAVVSALMHPIGRKPSLECITAEILDLCLKGKLKIRPLPKKKVLGIFGSDDFEILILDRSMEGIPKSEQMVFELISDAASTKYEGFIFSKKVKDKTPNKVTLEELKKYLLHDRMKSRLFAKEWLEHVEGQAEEHGLFSKKSGWIPFIGGTIAVAVAAILVNFLIVLFVIIEVVALVAIFPDAMPNRTKKGALHHRKWTLLKKFLNDFSNLKNMPPDAIVLWEQYLVYSIPLGVAKKVQKAMDHAFQGMKGEYRGRIFAGSYASFSSTGIGSVASSFSSAFASASGTSGGGGFGGGGGGAG